jgi:hypothetical protein
MISKKELQAVLLQMERDRSIPVIGEQSELKGIQDAQLDHPF